MGVKLWDTKEWEGRIPTPSEIYIKIILPDEVDVVSSFYGAAVLPVSVPLIVHLLYK